MRDSKLTSTAQSMAHSGGRLTIMLLALLCIGVSGCRRSATPALGTETEPEFDTPYLNARPGVQYVGDAACRRCHPEQVKTYRKHPMALSLTPLSQSGPERFDAAAHTQFAAFNTQFAVERRGAQVWHSEMHVDSKGRPIYRIEHEVRYALGSGSHGRAYLMDRSGYLFQSPISWLTQKGQWDLSPGFTADLHFERPVDAECLACHTNHAERVADASNRYREPVFESFGIGCERCHGPGQLHVALREGGDPPSDPDVTIVNPRRLAPELRESVCEQCHLQGDARVLRRGRDAFDYRPGLPMYLFWAVFDKRPELQGDRKFVSQVQQMHESRCFRESQGRMGCISCHDPHRAPREEEKVAHYRARCLQCHQETSCSLSPTQRRQKSPADDCMSCHMPRRATPDIAHSAATDHRVLRKIPAKETTPPTPLGVGDNPLVLFHGKDNESPRDLALALVQMARQQPALGRMFASRMQSMLSEAVQQHPDDIEAQGARIDLLGLQGRLEEALALCEEVLQQRPKREAILATAAMFAATLGHRDRAIDLWRRALEVNPWPSRYHFELAKVCADARRWSDAARECELALRTNPSHVRTRWLLVGCLLNDGKSEQAQTQFDRLMGLDPPDRERLRQWFADQTRPTR
jgi:predicted CXXCH cytochrome family protein